MVGSVASGHRLTLRSQDSDPRGAAVAAGAAALGVPIAGPVEVADVVYVEGDLDAEDLDRLGGFLVDPLLQTGTWEVPRDDAHHVEITLHPGVTDVAAAAVRHAGERLGVPVSAAATGRRVEFPPAVDAGTVDVLLRRVIANPVIENWTSGVANPVFHPDGETSVSATMIPVRDLDAGGLARLNAERALALDIAELEAILDHYRGEHRDPTDVELETLAQTWSEHCAHKTFRATIVVDGVDQPALLDRLRAATDAIDAPFVRSAFVGNAGVVSFADGTTLALKAETHNHPSAVEPFGGANTGVGGVIRDVLGAAHRPVAVTDVLCFGPPDLPIDELPDGSLHPRRIQEGVVAGVADYGNKIGLPTVAGAVLYDSGFITNPLVFCGCIGVAPDRPLPDGPFPGDRVVVLGGRTGRDGIRGATFSSATMDATTGEVAGASVQIGDPVTEKLLIDVLAGPADADALWTAITDCGAGGLSSAVGEMADGVGADVDLAFGAAEVRRTGPLGDLAVRSPGADGRRGVAGPAPRAPRPVRSSRRRAHRPRSVHRGRPARRPPRRRRRCGSGHRVPAPRATPPADGGGARGPRPPTGPTGGRRPGHHVAGAPRPPQHRVQGGDDPPLRPRDRRRNGRPPARRDSAATPRPTASSSPIPATPTGSPSASA